MPTLRREGLIRPHPFKQHPIQPPLILVTNTPRSGIPTHPRNPFRLRDVCCVDLLRCPLPIVDRALELRWVDGFVYRGHFADLHVGAVELQVRCVDVRVAPCEEGLVVVDISIEMAQSAITPL